jgi:hypothetical protein
MKWTQEGQLIVYQLYEGDGIRGGFSHKTFYKLLTNVIRVSIKLHENSKL